MIFKWITTISVFLFLVLPGCNKSKETEENSTTDARVSVKITRLDKGTIESVVTASGTTDALRKEKIFSPVAGRIIALKVLEGSQVHTGDVMLILRTKEAQAAFEGAQALMRNASTEQQKQEGQHALKLADSLQPQISVRARFDGVVASRNITEGELVSEQTELLTIIDPSTIVFIADIPINSIASIHPNLPTRIKFPQLTGLIDAVVDAVNPQADAQSQSVKVRLRFIGLTDVQQKLLKSNIPGTVNIITGAHHDVFVVDRTAVLHDDEANTYSLVIMTDDSLAKVIPITFGIQTDSLVEVKSDLLHAGINIITQGQYALTDSTRVTVEPR
jgi:multidrug efflux pump subunit AcrA (membrane-fusion protein)